MRRLFIVAWVLAPVALVAWHYSSSGQRQLVRDLATEQAARGSQLEKAGDASAAADAYRLAASSLPDNDKPSQQRLRLAWAKAEIAKGAMIEGQQRLQTLLTELERDQSASPELTRATRHALAESNYYSAFLMRREGAETDDWMLQAESARQQFRLLAEASGSQDTERDAARKNLEATIKLQQMDLSKLLADGPPPTKCPPCNGLSKRQKKDRGKQPEGAEGNQPDTSEAPPQDIRDDLRKAGAGVNQVEGSGS